LEEAEKKKIVEEQYEKLLRTRRRDVRSQPEVKSLVTKAIGSAILGVLALIYYDPAALEKSVDQPGFWSLPRVLGVVVGAIVGLVAGGLPGILGGGLLGLVAATVFIRFGLYIGLGAFVIAGVYFFRFRQRMRAVQLTAEESAARQVSIKNIEDYFRRKEELERARAVVAVAKGEAPRAELLGTR
jgi:predicted lipid-binding transport protein (Tim44 family)